MRVVNSHSLTGEFGHATVQSSVDTSCPQGDDLTADDLALAIQQPPRTVRRWLAGWHALGVAGVRTVPSPGRGGVSYRVSADLPARWLACELPSPHGVAEAA